MSIQVCGTEPSQQRACTGMVSPEGKTYISQSPSALFKAILYHTVLSEFETLFKAAMLPFMWLTVSFVTYKIRVGS